jgi:AcrR family transcriptional regulator
VPTTEKPRRRKASAPKSVTRESALSDEPKDEFDDELSTPNWQSKAVERSLGRSRAAAEKRSAAFVKAALALVERRGGQDFTVQELVNDMRISTRTYYQYFSSKEELLVAMFEQVQREDNRDLRPLVAAEDDPRARLKAFVYGILNRAHTGSPRYAVGRLLIEQFLQLQVKHPEELRHSYAGVLAYLTRLVVEAYAPDGIETAVHRRTAGLVLQLVVSSTQVMVLGSPVIDPAPTPEEVWQFCLAGMSALEAASGKDTVKAVPPRKTAAR